MDDLALLKARIDLLINEVVDVGPQGRALAGVPGQALCAEIAQTQLARCLAFTNARGDVLSLVVRAGRILMLSDSTSPGLVVTGSDLIGHPLSEGDNAMIAQLGQIMGRFTSDTDAIWVNSQYVSEDLEDAETGVLPPDLLGAAETIPATRLGSFVDQCREAAVALLWTDGVQDFARSGPQADIEMLTSLAAAEFEPQSGDGINPAPSCVVLGGPSSGGQGVLCGRHDGALVLVVFDVNRTGEMLTLWRSAFGWD